ncbi:MAG: hypothetical protein PHV33_09240 [Elusimicrobiales bacterium]|nr:hypothetical protein [Elusimicrobiales bacterium]
MRLSAYDRRLADSGLPPAVRLSLAAAGPELRAAARRDPGFFAGLEAFFSAVSGALGLPPEKALCASGYLPGDATPGRLEAALAELSAALFLRGEGFSGIAAVPRAAGRTADLRAARRGLEYDFEVRFVGVDLGEGAVKRLAAKFRSKAAQVKTSMKRRGGGRGGVVFVAGLPFAGGLTPAARLAATAAAVSAACGEKKIHICIVDGGGCAVFPAWE